MALIASLSQNNFDCKKVSIAKTLVLVLHRFFSKGFGVSKTSIFGNSFDSFYHFFFLILFLAQAHYFFIKRVVVLGIVVMLVIALIGVKTCKKLRFFISIYIDYFYWSIYTSKKNYVDNNAYLMGSNLALYHGIDWIPINFENKNFWLAT